MLKPSTIKTSLAALLIVILALPFASVLNLTPGAEAYSGITIDLDNPAFAGKGEMVQCTLTIEGGPASVSNGNYSYRIEITGKNTTGSSATPSTGAGPTGIWKVNITMPDRPSQTIKIKVNATSRNLATNEMKYLDSEFQMKVVDPIIITAEVFNNGPVGALNVSASFFADGKLLDKQMFNLPANTSTTLVYNWTFVSIRDGKHVVTISLDDNRSIAEFSNGNNVMTRTFYIEETSNPLGGVLTIAVIIMAVFVGLMYLQKPAKRKK